LAQRPCPSRHHKPGPVFFDYALLKGNEKKPLTESIFDDNGNIALKKSNTKRKQVSTAQSNIALQFAARLRKLKRSQTATAGEPVSGRP